MRVFQISPNQPNKMSLTICYSISHKCFWLMRDWKLEFSKWQENFRRSVPNGRGLPLNGFSRKLLFLWLSPEISRVFAKWLAPKVSILYRGTNWYLGTCNTQCLNRTLFCAGRCKGADSQVPSVHTPLVYLSCSLCFFLFQIPARSKALPETQIHFLDASTEDKQPFTVKILLLFLYLFW